MYIIVDFDDNILFWSDDFQEIDYMLSKKYKKKAACVYELDFCSMTIDLVKDFDDDEEDDEED